MKGTPAAAKQAARFAIRHNESAQLINGNIREDAAHYFFLVL